MINLKKAFNKLTSLVMITAVILSIFPTVLSAPYSRHTDRNTPKLTVGPSIAQVYDTNNLQSTALPKISCKCKGCDAFAELGSDGSTVEITLYNWEKYSDDISCHVNVYTYDDTESIIYLEGIPVTFIAPDGTFKKYTDANGIADYKISRTELEALFKTETPTPEPTLEPIPVPDATAVPEVTQIPEATIEPTFIPSPTQPPSVAETPLPAETPTATDIPNYTIMPSVTATPTPTPTPTPTKKPTDTSQTGGSGSSGDTKTPAPTLAPVATKKPAPTTSPIATKVPIATATPTVAPKGPVTTFDEYGNKHIVYEDGSETFLMADGKKVIYDSSFTKVYDVNDQQNNPLPKSRFLALRCNIEVERNNRTGMITLTLSNYDKDLFDYVSLPEVVVCEIRLSMDKQFWNTPISGVPIKFVTPDGTVNTYTDNAGAAAFTISVPSATITPKPTKSPKPTATPEPTKTPKPTMTPYPTYTPRPTPSPIPTITPRPTVSPRPTPTPIATEKPTPTIAPQNKITNFEDVASSHWAKDNISKMASLGAFSGYEDGTFRPDKQITHEEFLKVVMSLIYNDEFDAMPQNYVYLKNNDPSSSNYWTNRYAFWAQPYLTAAIDIGVVAESDYDIGTTETSITRGEMAKIMSRAVDYLGEPKSSSNTEISSLISDWNLIPDEYKDYIASVYSKGIIAGYSDGSFGSSKNLTRAEASAVVIRLIDKNQRGATH